MKRALSILLLLGLAVVLVWRGHAILAARSAHKSAGPKGGPPAPVIVADAARRDVPVEVRTFGAVEAAATVTIRPQVTGVLAEIGFTEGQEVRAGDVLARLDARPFEAALHQAEAAQARTLAQLANAARDAARMTNLFARGFVSETDRDQALTAVTTQQASSRGDAAAVESARILFDYCTIRAPMDGRTGRRLVDAGNLVAANGTALVTLNRLRPVRVTFAVPQAELAHLRDLPGLGAVAVEAILPDETDRPERGALVFLDNAVDPATGTIALKAEFPNSSNRLWPGQFVDVRMIVSVETNALTVPYRAVQNGQQGTYVFVVRDDLTVEVRSVRVARNREEESVIAAGLQAGDRVVVVGQERLGPGAKVQIRDAVGPSGSGAVGPSDRPTVGPSDGRTVKPPDRPTSPRAAP